MNFETHQSLAGAPAYSASEVAHMLVVPVSTIKAWSFGHKHSDGRPGRFRSVISPADGKRRLLSFANLCELHVLASIRRRHRVPLPTVRESLAFVSKELKTPRPLIAQQFLTNGIDLFIRHAGQVLNTSKKGQQALRGDFELALLRIEWSDQGMPVRLFPFTRSSTDLGAQPRAVVIDPRLSFGRPVLAHTGVTTEVIDDRFNAGDAPDEMAEDYGVAEADIWEAIRFERFLAAA
jgi:uncharacterized protein (DUF433 family)